MDTTQAENGNPVTRYGNNSVFQGSDIQGQVTAIQVVRLPEQFDHASALRRPEVTTTGVGREFTVSEVGLHFTVAAENPNSGTPFNPGLVTELELPKGYKALQLAPIFEAFCPGQGYSMIAPSSSAQMTGLENIRVEVPGMFYNPSSKGMPGGKIVTPIPLLQEAGDGTDGSRWRKYGNMNLSVAHLAYLAGDNPPTTASNKISSGTWWIGWGGSGGRYLWNDNNSTGSSDATAGVMDFEDYNNPNQYSRGYFIVSETATTMKVTLATANSLRVRIGNQRNGDFSDRYFTLNFPASGFNVPVPKKPSRIPFSMGQRYANAKGTGLSGNRYINPTSPGGGGPFGGGGTVINAKSVEVVDPNDVIRTWVTRHGDYRLNYIRLHERSSLPENERLFVPHPGWWDSDSNVAVPAAAAQLKVHSFTKAGGEWETGATPPQRDLVQNANYTNINRPDFVISPASSTFSANVPSSYPYSVDPMLTRDWDNGIGIAPDGAYWNKPDDIAKQSDGNIPPYFQTKNWDGMPDNAVNQTTAPNQLIPSPVMFGSIPSAASTGLQWTTLLFRPDITEEPGRTSGHLGSKDHSVSGNMPGAPPDHIVLDWFWMPVVQPYAISEPFSTAGKINMNYRIAPFTYIKRATGLHAVLKSEQILAIPSTAGNTYKDYTKVSGNGSTNINSRSGWRRFIDANNTLAQWEEKFNNGEFFKNASEICEQFLVPEGTVPSNSSASSIRTRMKDFWDDHRLTGDNTLERPYANIYPRLTTRSNTYRVHFKVQTLAKARSTEADTFDPERDSVTGESQGDALVERSIDPNDPAFDNNPQFNYIKQAYNGNFNAVESLDRLYSWRVRNISRFNR